MADKILTYVDASVLIYAAVKPTSEILARRMRALQVFNDPAREFVASKFLKLEGLPIPRFFHRQREIEFYEAYFEGVLNWTNDSELIEPALDIASGFGLGALDAIHIAAASSFSAEFVSAERLTKPIYRAYENISTIYET